MRDVFGLAGLLITIGVIAWILGAIILPYDKTVLQEGKRAREQAAKIAGRDLETGLTNQQSISLSAQHHNGNLESILVTDIIPNGPMAKNFGLKRNDSIVLINDMKLADIANNDSEMAKAWVYEASQREWSLTIVRDGQRLTLPLPEQKPVNATTDARKPGTSHGPGAGTPIQNQLDAIQKIPMH